MDKYDEGYDKGYADAMELLTKKPKSIDEQVTEASEELKELHNKFLFSIDGKHWMCKCPICRSLECGGDCQ